MVANVSALILGSSLVFLNTHRCSLSFNKRPYLGFTVIFLCNFVLPFAQMNESCLKFCPYNFSFLKSLLITSLSLVETGLFLDTI